MYMTIMALIPIISLLVCLLTFKMTAIKASAYSILLTMLISYFVFKTPVIGIAISASKGLALSLFVVLIIWGAIFLYNLVYETGALNVINKNIKIIVEDKFIQFLLLSWIFSAFLQGIAGFGVPVVVVVPILIGMGFDPIISAAGVLVGHSWAISFGSMGSSIYAIETVTKTAIENTVVWMAFFGSIAMFMTGIAVCYVYGGIKYIKKGFAYVFIVTVVMGTTLVVVTRSGMLSVIGLLTALTGLIAIYVIYRIQSRFQKRKSLYNDKLNLIDSVLPYSLIVLLSLTFYVLSPQIAVSLDFQGYITGIGNVVEPEVDYAKINLLKHPTAIIIIASAISIFIYRRKGVFGLKRFKTIINSTITKCVPVTITLAFLITMAILMMDSGLIKYLAQQIVLVTGSYYPLFAPYIGLLGSFITGSNTNSNVIFGSLQETVASTLGLSTAMMCGVQSIGASIGGGIGPTTVSLGATAAQLQGQESLIYKKTLIPTLMMALILGLSNYLVIHFMI